MKRAVAKVLMSENRGFTAQEIYGKLNYKDLSKVKGTHHVSQIIKSMRGIMKTKTGVGIRNNGSKYIATVYSINNLEQLQQIGGLSEEN